ncbi:hypothetical protein IAU60_003669 [Kwoniella sp. DSM 27419]
MGSSYTAPSEGYPPLYRSEPSHIGTPSAQTTMPDQGHGLGYQQRREERHQRFPAYPPSQDDPYNPDGHVRSNNPYDTQAGYSAQKGELGRPTRLERSESDSSTHPALPPIERLPARSSGAELSEMGGKDGLPLGWTKEDEEAERLFLSKGMIEWRDLRSWRFWIRKEWWYWYIIAVVAAVLVALMTIFHDDIVKWMQPFANWMKALPGGWAIPIGIFFVLSFPPLFGQEILAVLVGAVWGLWAGFGITAAGTFLGEVGNFYAFKYCLRSTAEKYERKNINYACMAHIVREGGFWLIFAIRLSAIPGHFSTAVFATCGMSIWIFMIATILTLPKQLIVVYLGTHFNNKDQETKTEKIVSYAVVALGFLITIWAAWYIYKKMHKARVHVWRKRRIEAASRGIAMHEVINSDANGGKEWLADGLPHSDRTNVDEEALSPILARGQREAYPNPYENRYASQDDMSAYHPEPVREQDIGYGYRPAMAGSSDSLPPRADHSQSQPYGDHLTPSAHFPEARSTGTTGPSVLHRDPSSATSASYPLRTDDHAEFPVPLPTSHVPHQAYGVAR